MRCLHFPIGAKGKGEEARASGGKGGFQFPAILAVIGMGWEGVVGDGNRGPIPVPYFTLSVHGGYLACHSIPLGKYIDDLAVHTECEDRLGWQSSSCPLARVGWVKVGTGVCEREKVVKRCKSVGLFLAFLVG